MKRQITLPESAWAILAALANLPPTLPGKRGPVPVSSTEQLRAALRRLAELAKDSGDATDAERELIVELGRLVEGARVRGGDRKEKNNGKST